jgi:hypothetical protein
MGKQVEQQNLKNLLRFTRQTLVLGATDAGPGVCRLTLARPAAVEATDAGVSERRTPGVSIRRPRLELLHGLCATDAGRSPSVSRQARQST